jgi:methylated-DNA-protein-cysteine methyltransferase related protein
VKLADDKTYRDRVYAIVRRIPLGRVMTYGQLALILGDGYTARTVGYVMHGADADVPWQRVINSQGKCSTARLTIPINLQQDILTAEGVRFNERGKCDLPEFRWFPEEFERNDNDETALFDG